MGQLNHLADRLVYVHPVLSWRRLFDEFTDAADDVAGSIGVPDDTAERLPDLLQFWRLVHRTSAAPPGRW